MNHILLTCLAVLLASSLVHGACTHVRIGENLGTGFDATPDCLGEDFGLAMANIGDFFSNDIEDLAVGAPGRAGGGAVFMLSMNYGGTVASHVEIPPPVPNLVSGYWGAAIANMGYMNGDDIIDLVVTDPETQGYHDLDGVFLLFMAADGSIDTYIELQTAVFDTMGMLFTPNDDQGGFGQSVCNMGDMNGDGVNDIAIGAPNTPMQYSWSEDGAVFLATIDPSFDGTLNNEMYYSNLDSDGYQTTTFGYSLAKLGDWSGDGVDDFAVGAPNSDSVAFRAGAVWIYFMDANPNPTWSTSQGYEVIGDYGVGGNMVTIDMQRPDDMWDYFRFGDSLASLPDLDGDGFTELAVGATGANPGGAVWVLFWRSAGVVENWEQGVSNAPDYVTGGNMYGRALTMLADLSGDDCPELVGGSSYDSGDGFRGSFATTPLVCGVFPLDTIPAPSCSNGGSVSGFACDCDPGNTFIGASCDVDCAPFPILSNTACDCTDTGYTGTMCDVDFEECASSPCMNDGICSEPVINVLECDCTGTGYTGDLCQSDVDECASSPCLNNGACTDNGTLAFVCNCTDTGYEGATCQTNIDDCLSSPCLNNGVCMDGVGSIYCDCSDTGYEGDSCQTDIDDCFSSPCLNDGICTDSLLNFKCNCSGTGFEGDICKTQVDECLSSPCLNAGLCFDGLNDYTCDCAGTGFTGLHCENDVDDCISMPCMAGTCVDTGVNDFMCNCTDTGYEGNLCATDIDECASSPCQNNGLCSDTGQYAFFCDCSDISYEGTFCETFISSCLSAPCPDGQLCTDTLDGDYVCTVDEEEGWTSSGLTSSSIPYGWTSSGTCTSCVAIQITVSDFANDANMTSELFASLLPLYLSTDVGGNEDEYIVSYTENEDGSVTYDVFYVNSEGEDVTDILDEVANSAEINDVTDDYTANAVSLRSNESVSEEDDADEASDGLDAGVLIGIMAIVIAGFLLFAIWYKKNKQSKVIDLNDPNSHQNYRMPV